MTLPEGMPEALGPSAAPRGGRLGRARPTSRSSAAVFDEVTRTRAKEIIARYPQSRSALLPLLHLVQSVEGHVSQDGIRFCADALELTTAEVSAVATFYTMYKRTPVRRAPGERVHEHAVRGARRRRHLRGACRRSSARTASRSATRRPRPTARSPWSTPSAWPPATSPRSSRSTTSTTTTRRRQGRGARRRAAARREAAPHAGRAAHRLPHRRAGAGGIFPDCGRQRRRTVGGT